MYLIKFTERKLEFQIIPALYVHDRTIQRFRYEALARSDMEGNLIQRFDSHILIIC